MLIYPAIDLKDGQCVRLVQGKADAKTVYSDDPGAIARQFAEGGAQFLHVVDLDGAFEGFSRNGDAIARIASSISIPFQVGGGIRSFEDVKAHLDNGACRVIIGTRALKDPDFITELLDRHGPDRIVLGIDARDGMVAVEGWVKETGMNAVEFGQQMRLLGVEHAVYTDIARDGALTGPNFEAIKEMGQKTGLKVIASGGVSSLEDVRRLKALEKHGVNGIIIGKAIYDQRLDLAEAIRVAAGA